MAKLRDTWRWLVRTAREAGEGEPVPIELERNREAAVEMGAQNPPDVPLYRFGLGLRAGFSGEQKASIPVFRRVNPNPHPVLKEIFFCEVAGSTLEAANVHALKQKVSRMLESLAPGGALPLAYFHVSAADYSLPVYEEGGRIVCPLIAAPNLKAADLAEMRRHVVRYLLNAGYVTDSSQVELRVVRPSDLKLVTLAALIRSIDDPGLWLPTVEGRSAEGLVIGLLGEATELRPREQRRAAGPQAGPPPAANDVASLLRLVGNEMVQAGRIEDPFALYAAQVRPEIWWRTEQLTDDVGHNLVCWLEGDEPARLALPLRHTVAGELLTALDDDGIVVFVGSDEPGLAERVGRYLAEAGFLRFQDSVEVVEAGLSEPVAGAETSRSIGDIDFPRLGFGGGPGPEPPAEPASRPAPEASDTQENHKEEVLS